MFMFNVITIGSVGAVKLIQPDRAAADPMAIPIAKFLFVIIVMALARFLQAEWGRQMMFGLVHQEAAAIALPPKP